MKGSGPYENFISLACLSDACPLPFLFPGVPQNAAAAALQDPTPAVYGVSLTPETAALRLDWFDGYAYLTITNTGKLKTPLPLPWRLDLGCTLSTNTSRWQPAQQDTITVRISYRRMQSRGASAAATVRRVSTGVVTNTAASS